METISDVCSNSSCLPVQLLSEMCLKFIYNLQVTFPRINPIIAFPRLSCSSCPLPSSTIHKYRLVQERKMRLMPRRIPSPLSISANRRGRCRLQVWHKQGQCGSHGSSWVTVIHKCQGRFILRSLEALLIFSKVYLARGRQQACPLLSSNCQCTWSELWGKCEVVWLLMEKESSSLPWLVTVGYEHAHRKSQQSNSHAVTSYRAYLTVICPCARL